MKRVLLIVVALAATAIFLDVWLLPRHTITPRKPVSKYSHSTKTSSTPTRLMFNKSQYSLTDPASIWVVVNKSHPLTPKSYSPSDLMLPPVKQRVPGAQEMKLRAVAANALTKLFNAAAAQNVQLLISTAYRSYSYQQTLYNNYVRSEGQAAADTFSARPGYSEHQTGLSLDFRAVNGSCPLKQCFAGTAEGKWLAANAYKYGFILRYPKGKDVITGYHYEPWHFRYVGLNLSLELHKQGVATLEEFFGVSGGTTY